jgi:hypothetical protein
MREIVFGDDDDLQAVREKATEAMSDATTILFVMRFSLFPGARINCCKT